MTGVTPKETLSCAAESVQGPVELPFTLLFPLLARSLLTLYFMLVAFLGTLLNCGAFYLVCKNKKLCSVSFALAVQIIAVDIFCSAVLVTVSLSAVLTNQWPLGEGMCTVIGALHIACNIVRVAFLMGLVADRFCSTFFAYLYPQYRAKVIRGFIITTYLVTGLLTVLIGFFDCYLDLPNKLNLQFSVRCSQTDDWVNDFPSTWYRAGDNVCCSVL